MAVAGAPTYEIRIDGRAVSLYRTTIRPAGRLRRWYRLPPRVDTVLLGTYALRGPYTFQWARNISGGSTMDIEFHGVDLLTSLDQVLVSGEFRKRMGFPGPA